MDITDMSYIIRSTVSNEFILHFPNHQDFRISMDSADRKDDFLNLIKLRFAHMKPDITLRVYGVPHPQLKDFYTNPQKKKYNINNTPSEEYRLHDEEIKSANEFGHGGTISTNDNTIALDESN
jgi:hypothetical protein